MDPFFLSPFVMGFVLGLRHAFEPDHLVAVSTLLHAEPRLTGIVRVGLSWGVGHTSTLMLGVMVVPLLGYQLGEAELRYFELPVGVMLLVLGGKAFYDAHLYRRRGATSGAVGSAPAGALPAGRRPVWRSYAIGTVHGMAGSGSLVLLMAATLTSSMQALLYAASYGTGSMLGMASVTLLVAVPLLQSQKKPQIHTGWILLSGVLSIALALILLYDVLL